MKQSRLATVPLELDDANELVGRWHRHHQKVVGHKFSIGCVDETGEIRGCAIVGRPVARGNQDGWTLEVVRVATDGTDNACSHLYAAAWRSARAQGYRRLGTYTLVTEPGTSLKAAGWVVLYEVKGRSWDMPSRPRIDKHPTLDKVYWIPADAAMNAIRRAWCAQTAVNPEAWTSEVPATGQCAVTALVIQDLLGGRLMRGVVNGESHYWNRLDDGSDVDLTRDQFGANAQVTEIGERDREYVLSSPDTAERYKRLRRLIEVAA